MASPWTTRKRMTLLWNIATCAVIVGVTLFVAMRAASPGGFVIAAVLSVVLALLVRRYRHAKRMAAADAARIRDGRRGPVVP